MTEQMDAGVEIDFGPWGSKQRFEKLVDLQTWVEAEKQLWQTTLSKLDLARARTVSPVVSAVRDKLRILEKAVSDPQGGSEGVTLISAASAVQSMLDSKAEIYVPANSPAANFVFDLAAKDATRAAAALGQFTRVDFQQRGINPFDQNWSPSFLMGTSDAALFEAGLADRTSAAEQAALRQLRSEWQQNLTILAREYERQVNSNATDFALRHAAEFKHDAEFARALATEKQAFSDAIKGARKEFENLQQVYKKHMALEAPVKYWNNRELFGRLAGVMVMLFAAFAGIALIQYFGDVVSKILAAAGDKKEVDWIHYSVAPASLLFGAWGIRIMLRIGLGLWDAGTDAGERSTIIKTYLALLKDPGGMPPEAITVLLQAIIRPSSRGDNPGLFDAEALKQASTLIKGKSE